MSVSSVDLACASNGSDLFVSALASSSSEFGGWFVACAGHSSDDFDNIGLPSYQHFRPSIIRHDQYPRWFEALDLLHCCFANALASGIELTVTTTAARIEEICLFMTHPKMVRY